MSVMYFNDRDNRNLPITQFFIFIVGIVMVVMGARFTWMDIQTTALFYDNLGMQAVSTINGSEGLLFGIALSMLQVYLGYRVALENARSRGDFWDKMKTPWVITYILVAIFDTITDADYRSYGFTRGGYLGLKSLVVSFIVYNMFSEWALGTGVKEVFAHFDSAISVIKDMSHKTSLALGTSLRSGTPPPMPQNRPMPPQPMPPMPGFQGQPPQGQPQGGQGQHQGNKASPPPPPRGPHPQYGGGKKP